MYKLSFISRLVGTFFFVYILYLLNINLYQKAPTPICFSVIVTIPLSLALAYQLIKNLIFLK